MPQPTSPAVTVLEVGSFDLRVADDSTSLVDWFCIPDSDAMGQELKLDRSSRIYHYCNGEVAQSLDCALAGIGSGDFNIEKRYNGRYGKEDLRARRRSRDLNEATRLENKALQSHVEQYVKGVLSVPTGQDCRLPWHSYVGVPCGYEESMMEGTPASSFNEAIVRAQPGGVTANFVHEQYAILTSYLDTHKHANRTAPPQRLYTIVDFGNTTTRVTTYRLSTWPWEGMAARAKKVHGGTWHLCEEEMFSETCWIGEESFARSVERDLIIARRKKDYRFSVRKIVAICSQNEDTVGSPSYYLGMGTTGSESVPTDFGSVLLAGVQSSAQIRTDFVESCAERIGRLTRAVPCLHDVVICRNGDKDAASHKRLEEAMTVEFGPEINFSYIDRDDSPIIKGLCILAKAATSTSSRRHGGERKPLRRTKPVASNVRMPAASHHETQPLRSQILMGNLRVRLRMHLNSMVHFAVLCAFSMGELTESVWHDKKFRERTLESIIKRYRLCHMPDGSDHPVMHDAATLVAKCVNLTKDHNRRGVEAVRTADLWERELSTLHMAFVEGMLEIKPGSAVSMLAMDTEHCWPLAVISQYPSLEHVENMLYDGRMESRVGYCWEQYGLEVLAAAEYVKQKAGRKRKRIRKAEENSAVANGLTPSPKAKIFATRKRDMRLRAQSGEVENIARERGHTHQGLIRADQAPSKIFNGEDLGTGTIMSTIEAPPSDDDDSHILVATRSTAQPAGGRRYPTGSPSRSPPLTLKSSSDDEDDAVKIAGDVEAVRMTRQRKRAMSPEAATSPAEPVFRVEPMDVFLRTAVVEVGRGANGEVETMEFKVYGKSSA
ncbi:hypothetical protein LTS10_012011 [Elasticomyces elasticus]|nr:hypothetical protein LTS10_012011 [Elasticomyces elasticus]